MSFSTPILYLAFNRPEETKITFNQLRSVKPSKLYIAQDGPRSSKEREQTEAVTEIIQNVDWKCELHYLIRKQNLGCKDAVNSALDWFFESEELGIILEDDILADTSFFHFSAQMLYRYKNDTRIMLISGNNLLGEYPGNADYFFSKIGAIWGWATWRRAWTLHDKTLTNWAAIREAPSAQWILPEDQWSERVQNMDKVYSGEIDTWDYQFTMTRLINSGLSILPRKNLIKNIGFGNTATHTKTTPKHIQNKIMSIDIHNIQHPIVISADVEFDRKVFSKRTSNRSVLKKIKQKLYGK